MKCEKSGNHTISYQSLLLSTTVLNDKLSKYAKNHIFMVSSVLRYCITSCTLETSFGNETLTVKIV